MRHHGVTEDTRDGILATLNKLGRDRTHHGKEDKARQYAHAIHAIEAGALEVRVRHMLYRVIGEQRLARYATVEATREQVLAELRGFSERQADRGYAEAADAVTHGALAVWADGVMYRVAEDELGEPERNPDQASIDAGRDARIAGAQDALDED